MRAPLPICIVCTIVTRGAMSRPQPWHYAAGEMKDARVSPHDSPKGRRQATISARCRPYAAEFEDPPCQCYVLRGFDQLRRRIALSDNMSETPIHPEFSVRG